MTVRRSAKEDSFFTQLRWFVRLRWIAGSVVIVGALVDWVWLHWHNQAGQFAIVGAVILSYNGILLTLLNRTPSQARRRSTVMPLVWAQLLSDLFCLTILMVGTGGLRGPLAGFFVFHMVFSSLLLTRRQAYASCGAALLILTLGLISSGQWPENLEQWLSFIGIVTTMILTVFLCNHITTGLRRQRRSLVRKNRRIRAISRKLRRTQNAMLQHEKMVALGQMAAGVAHEVANPLASMDSLLQLMQRKPDRMSGESISTLRGQIDRINNIIRQMKSFSHPVDMELKTQLINDVVEEAIGMVSFDPRWKTVRLDRQFSPDAGSLALSPNALQQVIVNLVINALDALADVKEPRITLSTQRTTDACLVAVSDNGHGISPELMDRLFEPFFTTKPVGKGTGLGLSISYGLIARHDGTISVTSEAGKSTTFTIRLPIEIRSRRREKTPV